MNHAEDEEIIERAAQYAKKNCKRIVSEITEEFGSEEIPVSIFMAGSPGAGKTEVSKWLLRETDNILIIDADELRSYFEACGYDGRNSHLFQKGTTKLVHEIHSASLKKGISFLLDGTFANERIARENIQRSLKRGRDVFVLFVHQSPKWAWHFVQERELVEGRRIQPEVFAEKFCAAREVANKMKEEFGNKIALGLICKNIDGSNKFYETSIQRIEDHISDKYSKQEILAQVLDQA